MSVSASPSPIRVTIVQPALPKYRVPIFSELARRPGIDLRVVYGTVDGLENVTPNHFTAVPSSRWVCKLAGLAAMVQAAEWTYCTHRYSDVVVLRWSPRSVLMIPATLRARLAGVPVVLWGHGYSKNERRWWSRVRNWLASLATALVFYDSTTRDTFIAKGWDPSRLFVALNTVDRSEIDAARQWWQDHPLELAQFRAQRGLDHGPVILFVSRLAPANRVDLLIRATAEISAQFPGLRTVIIGNGAAEKARLRLLARELGVGNTVVFEDGIYDERKLAPWFLSASVFCYPANIGLSLIHAFGYGLPVVTSDNRAIQNPEIVALEPGVNGAVYVHGSAYSLADTLRTIVSDESMRENMSLAARRTVERDFTVQRMVDGLEQAIRYAVGVRPVRSAPPRPELGESGIA